MENETLTNKDVVGQFMMGLTPHGLVPSLRLGMQALRLCLDQDSRGRAS